MVSWTMQWLKREMPPTPQSHLNPQSQLVGLFGRSLAGGILLEKGTSLGADLRAHSLTLLPVCPLCFMLTPQDTHSPFSAGAPMPLL